MAPDGVIATDNTDSTHSGKIDLATVYGGAQPVSLSSVHCRRVANVTFDGVVFATPDTAPAAWQLVAENTSSVLDVLAFR